MTEVMALIQILLFSHKRRRDSLSFPSLLSANMLPYQQCGPYGHWWMLVWIPHLVPVKSDLLAIDTAIIAHIPRVKYGAKLAP